MKTLKEINTYYYIIIDYVIHFGCFGEVVVVSSTIDFSSWYTPPWSLILGNGNGHDKWVGVLHNWNKWVHPG